MCDMRYSQCNGDHTIFYKHRGSRITIMVVCVDDRLITGDDVDEIKKQKERLGKAFEVKYLGPLHYFFGIEIARSSKGIILSQRKYILHLLAEIGCLDVVHVVRPFIRITKCVLSQVTNGSGKISEASWAVDIPLPYET